MSTKSMKLIFFVNGKKVVEVRADPEMTLLHYLRQKLGLTGTKLGCAEGGCGACTVMVSKYDRDNKQIRHYSVNACLAPVCSMHGLAVTTVEGIGSTKTKLHPVQERIANSHGSQCGFCTPGIVMSMYALLRNKAQPTTLDMESAFEGNLCRCTGYRPILEGFKSFTTECCGNPENCCRGNQPEQNGPVNEDNKQSCYVPYDPNQEPIFPPELLMNDDLDMEEVIFKGERSTWYRPTSLERLLELKSDPTSKIIIGNSEIGVEVKFKNMFYKTLVYAADIKQLTEITHTAEGIVFGGSVTLTHLDETLKEAVKSMPESRTQVFAAIIEMLRWFAGHQIRNVAVIAGNITTASPISDLNPLFLSAGCHLTLVSKSSGSRTVKMDHNFFLSYRKTVIKPDEVLLNILIPFTKPDEFFYGYKQAHRREDDIAIVNAGIRVLFEEGTNVIKEAAFSYGGMAPITVIAVNTAKAIVGRKWEDSLVQDVCTLLEKDLPLSPDAPGGTVEYRRTLTTSFFYKFYLTVQLKIQQKEGKRKIPSSFKSATSIFHGNASKGSQVFDEVGTGQLEDDSVGRPLVHVSAAKQSTGEAVYCDDMPMITGELYLALVTSTEAHAKIINIDPSEALSMSGVVTYLGHGDIPQVGSNQTGAVVCDEEIFASEEVHCQGQVIGAIVADSQAHAQRAAKQVQVKYEKLPPIITIEDAIEAKSYIPPIRKVVKGNIDQAFAVSDHTIQGEMRVGGQEHFYLETHVTVAIPKGEDGEMEIFCSSQGPSKAQTQVAAVLGVPVNRILIRVKRMGGGFGGKETRFSVLLLPVAIAAFKLNKPVRCMLDRDEDMVITGGRHPFLGKYKVGFANNGKIQAVEVDLYSNAGCSADLSYSVMERALFHSDCCYNIPNIRVTGYPCRTNLPSNTAFRGFGGPQGMMIGENWVSDIAVVLGITQEQVREVNMYQEGDLTHFNQTLTRCNIRKCWQKVLSQSDFYQRKNEVDVFNSENRWKKRGIAVIPTKFGISFTATFMNQAGALILVYTDGSVLLTHGGTEMGQGLHTKMIQVASRALKIPVDRIHISETSTNTVPNTSPTAASASSDLNGMAVIDACRTIMERLEPYMTSDPKGSWDDWVRAAYFDRVSLSATGFYKTPDINYSWENNSGMPFNYFTFGAACSEVEIDCLTGDHQVLRTDIVMDVGSSLNPAIDIGQIEGGFIQGYGLFTLEELRFSPDGFLHTRGPGAYKIPAFGDIPTEMNVSLLRGSLNDRAVYSSKAIGEPPLFLASSVFYAIKYAIYSARADVGTQGTFRLDSPATAERIRMACVDRFTQQFPTVSGDFKPWFVPV